MGNIRKDESLKFVTIEHPVLGTHVINDNLVNISTAPLSDTEEISDPGAGGGRVVKFKKDTARMISVEVQVGSYAELFLTRTKRYRKQYFSLQWADESNGLIESQGGNGLECHTKDTENNRGSDTKTFEIVSLEYSGD